MTLMTTPTQKLNSISPLFDALALAKTAIWNALDVPADFRGCDIKDLTDKVWKLTDDDCILFGEPGEELDSEAVTLEVHDFVRREHHVLVVTVDHADNLEVLVFAHERKVRA